MCRREVIRLYAISKVSCITTLNGNAYSFYLIMATIGVD